MIGFGEGNAMSSELKDLLTRMRNSHLEHAADLKRLADAGVKLRLDGDPSTILDMVRREYDAADALQKTIDRII
jgi:hypothetical protein